MAIIDNGDGTNTDTSTGNTYNNGKNADKPAATTPSGGGGSPSGGGGSGGGSAGSDQSSSGHSSGGSSSGGSSSSNSGNVGGATSSTTNPDGSIDYTVTRPDGTVESHHQSAPDASGGRTDTTTGIDSPSGEHYDPSTGKHSGGSSSTKPLTEKEQQIVDLAKQTGYTGQLGEMAKNIESQNAADTGGFFYDPTTQTLQVGTKVYKNVLGITEGMGGVTGYITQEGANKVTYNLKDQLSVTTKSGENVLIPKVSYVQTPTEYFDVSSGTFLKLGEQSPLQVKGQAGGLEESGKAAPLGRPTGLSIAGVSYASGNFQGVFQPNKDMSEYSLNQKAWDSLPQSTKDSMISLAAKEGYNYQDGKFIYQQPTQSTEATGTTSTPSIPEEYTTLKLGGMTYKDIVFEGEGGVHSSILGGGYVNPFELQKYKAEYQATIPEFQTKGEALKAKYDEISGAGLDATAKKLSDEQKFIDQMPEGQAKETLKAEFNDKAIEYTKKAESLNIEQFNKEVKEYNTQAEVFQHKGMVIGEATDKLYTSQGYTKGIIGYDKPLVYSDAQPIFGYIKNPTKEAEPTPPKSDIFSQGWSGESSKQGTAASKTVFEQTESQTVTGQALRFGGETIAALNERINQLGASNKIEERAVALLGGLPIHAGELVWGVSAATIGGVSLVGEEAIREQVFGQKIDRLQEAAQYVGAIGAVSAGYSELPRESFNAAIITIAPTNMELTKSVALGAGINVGFGAVSDTLSGNEFTVNKAIERAEVGAQTGFVAPIFGGIVQSGLTPQLATSALQQAATKVAGGVIVGGALGVPYTYFESWGQNQEVTSDKVASNIVMGAALGGAFEGVGVVGEKLNLPSVRYRETEVPLAEAKLTQVSMKTGEVIEPPKVSGGKVEQPKEIIRTISIERGAEATPLVYVRTGGEGTQAGVGTPTLTELISGKGKYVLDPTGEVRIESPTTTEIVKKTVSESGELSTSRAKQYPELSQAIIKETLSVDSPYQRGLPTKTEYLGKEELGIYYDLVKTGKGKLIGSGSRQGELATEYDIAGKEYTLTKTPKDIEAEFQTDTAADLQKKIDWLVQKWTESGKGEYREGTDPFTVQKKVDGEWVKVAELKGKGSAEVGGEESIVGEYVLGYKKAGLPTKVEGVYKSRLNEELRGTMQGTARFRFIEGDEGFKADIFPTPKRVKDIGSVSVSARTLAENNPKLKPLVEQWENLYPEELVRTQVAEKEVLADFSEGSAFSESPTGKVSPIGITSPSSVSPSGGSPVSEFSQVSSPATSPSPYQSYQPISEFSTSPKEISPSQYSELSVSTAKISPTSESTSPFDKYSPSEYKPYESPSPVSPYTTVSPSDFSPYKFSPYSPYSPSPISPYSPEPIKPLPLLYPSKGVDLSGRGTNYPRTYQSKEKKRGKRGLYSDLISIAASQARYGSGTTAKYSKIEKYGRGIAGTVPTAEQLAHGETGKRSFLSSIGLRDLPINNKPKSKTGFMGLPIAKKKGIKSFKAK